MALDTTTFSTAAQPGTPGMTPNWVIDANGKWQNKPAPAPVVDTRTPFEKTIGVAAPVQTGEAVAPPLLAANGVPATSTMEQPKASALAAVPEMGPVAPATTAPAAPTPLVPGQNATPSAVKAATQGMTVDQMIALARQFPENGGLILKDVLPAMASMQNANTNEESRAALAREQAVMTPHPIAQEQEYDPVTGMATRNKNIFGTYNQESKGWDPIKLPTLEAPKPQEGATGKDKQGRAVVVKNGVWVAK